MEVLLMAVVGLVVSLVSELSKKSSVPVGAVLVFLSIIVASFYQGIVQFAPEVFKANLSTFALGTMGTASLIYGFLLKKK